MMPLILGRLLGIRLRWHNLQPSSQWCIAMKHNVVLY